jgi:hypothetical protein
MKELRQACKWETVALSRDERIRLLEKEPDVV